MRAAGGEPHHDFLERGVPRALAHAAYGALDLPGARPHPGERIGDGEPEVVVAVDREDRVRERGDALAQANQQAEELLRRRVAHRIGNVDDVRARGDGGFHRAAEEVGIGPGGVLGGKLDVGGERAGEGDHPADLRKAVLAGHAQLLRQVQVARCEERVDARAFGALQRFGGAADVLFQRAGETGDAHGFGFGSDFADGGEVVGGSDGEPGFEHVHAEGFELAGHAALFGAVHGEAGGLFAVAQGGVENLHHVGGRASGRDGVGREIAHGGKRCAHLAPPPSGKSIPIAGEMAWRRGGGCVLIPSNPRRKT